MSSTPPLQSRLVHAAYYASLLLQVSERLFPNQKFFALSQDQRRIVDSETTNLLLQARWKVESKGFVEQFAIPQPNVEMAPAGTVLGEKLPEPKQPDRPGHYA